METKFMVEPIGLKRRYYSNLVDIRQDFSRKELEGSFIDVIYGAVTVGHLNTEKVLEEVYHAV